MTLKKYHCVPTIHAQPIVDNLQLRETMAMAGARRWRAAGAYMLVLSGKVGTGKSLAAAWAAADYLRATATENPWGRLVYFSGRLWVSSPHLSRFAPWSEELVELEAADFLVIDDLGEEEATPRTLATISSLLTTRDSNARPTIITTNLDGATFKSRYGERIIDRLRQSGTSDGKADWWIRCTEESLRGRIEPQPKLREVEDTQ